MVDGLRIEFISRGRPAEAVNRGPSPTHRDVLGPTAPVFDVEDLSQLTHALTSSGVEILETNEPMFGQRSTLIRDPEANLVNLPG